MNDRLRIALYQPDIAGNTGTILRFAACLGLDVDIIEPAGFPLSDRTLKRAGMDYLEMADLTRHVDWHAFEDWRGANARRLVLLSTKAATAYTDFAFSICFVVVFLTLIAAVLGFVAAVGSFGRWYGAVGVVVAFFANPVILIVLLVIVAPELLTDMGGSATGGSGN